MIFLPTMTKRILSSREVRIITGGESFQLLPKMPQCRNLRKLCGRKEKGPGGEIGLLGPVKRLAYINRWMASTYSQGKNYLPCLVMDLQLIHTTMDIGVVMWVELALLAQRAVYATLQSFSERLIRRPWGNCSGWQPRYLACIIETCPTRLLLRVSILHR